DRAIVSITNENAAYFELSIETENGEMVYYKQSNKPLTDYQKIFDFTDLKDGKYVMNLKVNDTKLSKNFEVYRKGIYVGDSKLTFDPYFAYDNNVLKLSYLNFDQNKLKLYFYNDEGLVYETKLGNDFAISSGYDLSKLEKGNYRVVLSSFNNEFTYNLEK
ncbi:MAG TPA: hypothetical protein VKA38_12335, partial [Draconibacterium sp.]|nr:hypothetical protein [Draconibacterium sp.]